MKQRYSDRIGKTKFNEVFQIDNINEALRNTLWNWVYILFYSHEEYTIMESTTRLLCVKYFKEPLDRLPNRIDDYVTWFRNKFMKADWYEVYNLIEYFYENGNMMREDFDAEEFKNSINSILEEENSGYRFINGILSQITNEEELKSIECSIDESRTKKMYGTAKHFETAIELLSKRPDPDYRNSIKESISAVESLVKQLVGEKGGGLDKALTLLDNKVKFHGAFKSALSSLYGYTSDESGIRHPILEEKDIGFDEAKYMLVSCSAFVNFIIAKAEKAGLLK